MDGGVADTARANTRRINSVLTPVNTGRYSKLNRREML